MNVSAARAYPVPDGPYRSPDRLAFHSSTAGLRPAVLSHLRRLTDCHAPETLDGVVETAGRVNVDRYGGLCFPGETFRPDSETMARYVVLRSIPVLWGAPRIPVDDLLGWLFMEQQQTLLSSRWAWNGRDWLPEWGAVGHGRDGWTWLAAGYSLPEAATLFDTPDEPSITDLAAQAMLRAVTLPIRVT